MYHRGHYRNIAAVSSGPDGLDLVGIGRLGSVVHQHWDNASDIFGGTGWTDLGGDTYYQPTLISPGLGKLFVFILNPERILQWKYYGRSHWWPSEKGFDDSLGGPYTGAPAAVSWDSDTVDLFVKDDKDSYLHNPLRKDVGWIGWGPLGGEFISDPAAVTWGPGRLDVFGLSVDGAYYRKSWVEGYWSSSWESIGDEFVSAPVVVSKAKGHIRIFGIRQGGYLFTRYFEAGAWSTWTNLGGPLTSEVSVQKSVTGGLERYDVFALDQDDNLIQKTRNGTWLPWVKHLGPFRNAPTVAGRSPNHYDVFTTNDEGNAVHQAWTKDGWSPAISRVDNLGGEFV